MSDPHTEQGSPQPHTDPHSAAHSDLHAAHGAPAASSASPDGTLEAFHVDRYEAAWMRASAIIIVIFFIGIVISGFANGIQVPGAYATIDPESLYDEGSPFANPEVRELGPGRYEAYIRSQIWQFTPSEIRVPAGSKVTFYVTSQDVQHGFKITGTNINMMALPGYISKLTAEFDTPGTHTIICHEYCGLNHHTMFGRIIVEAPAEEVAAAE
jgi:cytochrome c oxidase subunit 2